MAEYLIYDQSDELIDVLQFDTPDELASYKKANPKHEVRLATEESLIESLLIDDEDEYIDDDID